MLHVHKNFQVFYYFSHLNFSVNIFKSKERISIYNCPNRRVNNKENVSKFMRVNVRQTARELWPQVQLFNAHIKQISTYFSLKADITSTAKSIIDFSPGNSQWQPSSAAGEKEKQE